MKRDMRRINKISDACNRLGEWFTYAKVGTGKNSTIITLRNGCKQTSDYNLIGIIYAPKRRNCY